MKGVTETVFSFFLWIIVAVSIFGVLVWLTHGEPISQANCRSIQATIISNLRIKMGEASMRHTPISHPFEVLNCVKCIWYDTSDEELIVVYSVREKILGPEESMVDTYNLSTQFINMGCDCDRNLDYGCDDKDPADPTIYCANLRPREDPYQFEISKTSIRCLNCPNTYKPC